jgi:hypothetical protein
MLLHNFQSGAAHNGISIGAAQIRSEVTVHIRSRPHGTGCAIASPRSGWTRHAGSAVTAVVTIRTVFACRSGGACGTGRTCRTGFPDFPTHGDALRTCRTGNPNRTAFPTRSGCPRRSCSTDSSG